MRFQPAVVGALSLMVFATVLLTAPRFPLPQPAPGKGLLVRGYIMLNTPPTIDPLVALDSNGRRVSNAATGATVTLNARVSDRDKDTLGFLSQIRSGTLSSPTDPKPKWTLPRTPGNHAQRSSSTTVKVAIPEPA